MKRLLIAGLAAFLLAGCSEQSEQHLSVIDNIKQINPLEKWLSSKRNLL